MLTIDNIFAGPRSDFLDIEDNYKKYADYNVVNVNELYQANSYIELMSIITKASEIFPQNTEVIVNFHISLINPDTRGNIYYVSGQALVPKENNIGGPNVNNN